MVSPVTKNKVNKSKRENIWRFILALDPPLRLPALGL